MNTTPSLSTGSGKPIWKDCGLPGLTAYNAEQEEKVRLLGYLLSTCNDGRRKTLFCLAVNLLELSDVRTVVDQLMVSDLPTVKERAVYAATLLQKTADEKGISLKLNRKK